MANVEKNKRDQATPNNQTVDLMKGPNWEPATNSIATPIRQEQTSQHTHTVYGIQQEALFQPRLGGRQEQQDIDTVASFRKS